MLLQDYDGSFASSEALHHIVGVSGACVIDRAAALQCTSDQYSTAAAVARLETTLAALRDDWGLAVAKACDVTDCAIADCRRCRRARGWGREQMTWSPTRSSSA